MPLRITVAICTHNGAAVVRKALRSLEAQTLAQDDFEVLVVDNASSDETPAIVEEEAARRRNIRWVREQRLGLSAARNTAARFAASPLLAYMDDDAQAVPEWLEAVLDAFDNRSPAPACVGGPVTLDWDGSPPAWLPPRYQALYSGLDLGPAGHFLASPEEYLIGANIAFRLAALQESGGFDENLGRKGRLLISGEESAVLNHFRERGMPLYYEPRALVSHFVHPIRRTRKWLARRMYWDGASQPFIDYGKGKTGRFYFWHSCRDVKRLGEIGISMLTALVNPKPGRLVDAELSFIQRLGRLRTDLLLTATRPRREPGVRMHICYLSLDYPTHTGGSGVGTQVHTLAHALVAEGYRVTVIALAEAGLPDKEDDRGVEVRRLHPGNLHWYCSRIPWLGSKIALPVRELEYSLGAFQAVRRLDSEQPVDVIEGTETGMLFVALRPKAPMVIRLHGDEYTFARHTPGGHAGLPLRLARLLQRVALRRARMLISPSEAHAREIQRELGESAPHATVIPNNIPALQAVNSGARVKPGGGPQVLYAGRLASYKGIGTLLEAARQIHAQVPDARFVLAGGRHSSLPEAELRAMLERSGLNGNIELPGYVPQEQLSARYHDATVCVCPSYYETFGLSALEAMAAGVPVVATDAGGYPEIVEDGVSGLLVKAGSSQALAEAVIRLLGDAELRSRIGNAGREHAYSGFEVHRQLRDNIRLYELAAGRRHGFEVTDRSLTSRTTGGAGREADSLGDRIHFQHTGEHVFFSPHFDDAAISCGGLIELLRRKGASVTVVTAFTKLPAPRTLSAFARHLHRKWNLADDALDARRREDWRGMAALDVKNVEYWNFPDAPYRMASDGRHLYTNYQQLRGSVAPQDAVLQQELKDRVVELLREKDANATFYFPAAIGGQVDHRLLHSVGFALCGADRRIRFYEDWPYVEKYRAGQPQEWVLDHIEVPLERKMQATRCYQSQFREPEENLARRFQDYENYWELRYEGNAAEGPRTAVQDIYKKIGYTPRLRDIRRIASRYRWHHLDEILPEGRGVCLDFGAGRGRHRALAERRGYRWIGLEKMANALSEGGSVQGEAERTPFASASADCVIAWQVMEYVEQPEQVFAEAARVLAPGGVFCGSVSFLEPVHGKTYYGMSPLLLERLLSKYGFEDISVTPGLSGFALQTWTWLRRVGGPGLGWLALPVTAALTGPALGVRFMVSWFWKKVGRGTGHGMRWVTETQPLEFAGHVLFVARKTHCT